MKIIKTSQQAKADKAKEDAAVKEVLKCPECGQDMRLIGRIKSITATHKLVYQTECPLCGCIWESDEF